MHGIQCTFVLLVLSSVLLLCDGEAKSFRFCGGALAEALRLACEDSGYNAPFWDASPTVEATTPPAIQKERIGVATECCHHGCTWSTLLSYCQNSKKPSRISQIDDQLYAKLRFGHLIIGQNQDDILSAKSAAALPEVAVTKKHKGRKGRKRRMGRNGDKKRNGRGGRKRNASNRCSRRKRPTRARKNFDSIKRSAPLFGTVSPEYLRQPRTLDEVPYPYHRMQTGF